MVILSLSSYSQTDTTNVIVLDTTKVILPTKVARLAFQDLLRYDGAKLEIVELYKKDEQFGLERQKSESLLKELKGQRTKTFFYKVGSFVGIIATSILLLR